MHEIGDAISGSGGDVIISIEVSAGAKKDMFPSGYNTWRKAIGCRISAPPVGGRANRAVIELIAGALDIPKARVQIIGGATSTSKRVLVRGIDRSSVQKELERLM